MRKTENKYRPGQKKKKRNKKRRNEKGNKAPGQASEDEGSSDWEEVSSSEENQPQEQKAEMPPTGGGGAQAEGGRDEAREGGGGGGTGEGGGGGGEAEEPVTVVGMDEEAANLVAWQSELHRRGKVLFVISTPLSARFLAMLNYFLFLTVLLLYIYTGRNQDTYLFGEAIRDHFVYGEYMRGYDFASISNPQQYFDWLNNQFVPAMYPFVSPTAANASSSTSGGGGGGNVTMNTTPTSAPTAGSTPADRTAAPNATTTAVPTAAAAALPPGNSLILNGIGYRLGRARLRQLRMGNESCTVASLLEDSVQRCHARWDGARQEKGDFQGGQWVSWRDNGPTPDAFGDAFKTSYPGSGFPVTLPDYSEDVRAALAALEAATWLDVGTRAVFLEFNLYSPGTDLIASCVLTAEFNAAGDVGTSAAVVAAPLLRAVRFSAGKATARENAGFAVEILMYCLVFLRFISFVIDVRRQGSEMWFFSIFNKMLFVSYVLFVAMALMRLLSTAATLRLRDDLATDSRYVPLGYAVHLHRYTEDAAAFVALIWFMLFFGHLKFNYGLNQFTLTVLKAFADMASLLVILAVLVAGFALAFLLEFGHGAKSYKDFNEALLTLFETSLGSFDIEEIRYVNREMGPLLFMLYVIMMVFIVLSMLFAIVNMAYADTRVMFALQNKNISEDPVFVDICKIYDLIVDWLHEKIPKTQKLIPTYEEMAKKAKGEQENLEDIVGGRRGKQAVQRELVRQGSRGSTSQNPRGRESMQADFGLNTELKKQITEVEWKLMQVEDEVNEEESQVEANVETKGEFKKDLMRELLLVEQQQRVIMRKIETLTLMAKQDALREANNRHRRRQQETEQGYSPAREEKKRVGQTTTDDEGHSPARRKEGNKRRKKKKKKKNEHAKAGGEFAELV